MKMMMMKCLMRKKENRNLRRKRVMKREHVLMPWPTNLKTITTKKESTCKL